MIGFILLPLFIFLIYFFIKLLKRYLKTINLTSIYIEILLYVFMYSGLFFVTLAFFINPSYLKSLLNKVGYLLIGFELYFVLGAVLSLILYIVLIKIKNSLIFKKIPLYFCLIFSITFSLYGVYNAHDLKISNYSIDVNKSSNIKNLNIVLISDLHIGYNVGLNEIRDLVKEINNINPDIVLIAGDLFDNEFESIYEPDEISNRLADIDSKYGVYATLGNHDVNEKIFLGFTFSWLDKTNPTINNEMIDFISNSNINILYDDSITINDVQIYGRPDRTRINFNQEYRLNANEVLNKLDDAKPIIIVDHEPTDYDLFKDLGVDMYLCGHTHNGQIFPLNLTSRLIWDNSSGYKKYDNMHNIVTSGVGLYGIDMRTFTNPDICNILINFN